MTGPNTPSARITGDKDRENPVEGAPYGEGLIGRIDQLEHDLALARRGCAYAQDQQLRLMTERSELLEAARMALNYIANTEGELGITLSSGDALRAAIAKAGAA